MLQPQRDYDASDKKSVHARILAVAAASPDAIAIRDEGIDLSYGCLERRATALARRLMRGGVVGGSVIAVRIRRSADQIVALLGVLMAGCAFVVVDPDDPEDRRKMMIADSGAAGVVARAADGDLSPSEIDLGHEEYGRGIDLLPVSGHDLAYIVYTSGTTGVPNGVEITHDNLLNFMDWTISAFAVSAADRAGYSMGLTFDAAQSEIWPYLAAGASIEVVEPMTRTSADLLRGWLIARQVTIGTIPTALAEQLLSAQWPEDVGLRLILTGGDVLRAFPRTKLPFDLINNYGPSECTIVATSGQVPVREGGDGTDALPTIGRPIDGVDVHILDEAMKPVRPGDVGELWIGGRCVGRGYRNRAALTASKFRPDPFRATAGARLYRTGDLARQLDFGEYAFCGRTDTQAKIRGVRIEMDEVAVNLQQHPAIGGALLTVRDHAALGVQLVAYVVPVPGRSVETLPRDDEMRDFLAARLPRSHIPARFIGMPALPLTAHGKIDHDALPEPAATSREGRAPETETELVVADIVTDVLGIEEVAAIDDFFLIGGHSMLATQVVIQCREIFDVELTLRDLFEAPTIEGLAAEIERRMEEKAVMPTAAAAPDPAGIGLDRQ